MSLISDALKRAQLSKPATESGKETIVPVDGILDQGIFGGTSSRRNTSAKAYVIIGILSFALVLSLFYSYSSMQKKPAPIPQVKISPAPVLPATQVPRPIVAKMPEKKAIETKTVEAAVQTRKPYKGSAAKVAKVGPRPVAASVNIDPTPAKRKAAGAEDTIAAPAPVQDTNKKISVEEAKEAIRAGIKAQKAGQENPAGMGSVPVSQGDRPGASDTAEKSASEFTISSSAAEKDAVRPATQGSRNVQDGRVPEKEHNNLGVKCYQRSDLDGALEHFLSAVKINPNNSESYVNLGIVYKRMNRIHDALKAYKQAIASKPAMAEAHYNLAILYDEQADYKRAAQAYKQFLRLAGDKYQTQKERVEERLKAIHPGG